MKALLLTEGTRGNVQPFVALAQGLQSSGHEVILGAPESSKSLAETYGIKFNPLEDTYSKLMTEPDFGNILENRRIRRHRKLVAKYSDSRSLLLEQIAAMSEREGADIVVHHYAVPGQHVADSLGVPAVPVLLSPGIVPTSLVPHMEVKRPLPRALNRASYSLVPILSYVRAIMTIRHPLHLVRTVREFAAWRHKRLHIPRRYGGRRDPLRDRHGRPNTVLQAFTRHILPAPLDFPESVHTTGYWFLPSSPNWQPPAQLCEFIAAGDTPVCVGFGSMVGADPKRTGRIVATALQKAQARAVVLTGWGGIDLGELLDDVFMIDQVPHDWLFPQMAAVVHVSGGGVSSAALAAGRPQVPCPFPIDSEQRLSGQLMHARGVATAPLPQHDLNSDTLADAIRRAVTDEVMAQRARELAQRIRAEDGVATAITQLESLTARVYKTR